jgi:hypothetical protein
VPAGKILSLFEVAHGLCGVCSVRTVVDDVWYFVCV